MQEFLQYLFSGLTSGAIYAVIALGFSVLFAATEIINFAQGEFVMLGALILVTFWTKLGLPLPAAFAGAVLITAVIGLVFERSAIRTVKKQDPIVLVIITVGAGIFLRGVAMLIWGKNAQAVPPFSKAEPLEIGGAYLLAQSVWVLAIVLILVVLIQLFYSRTLTGKAMAACAIDKKAASIVGIGTQKMGLLAFGLSAGLGGLAGVIIAPITMNEYGMGAMLGLKGFCAAMLGGLGSTLGAVVGGFILGIVEAMAVGYGPGGDWKVLFHKDAVAFMLLLLILYARPTGIFGGKSTTRF